MSEAEVFHRLGVAVWSAVAVLWLALAATAVRRERALGRRVVAALGGQGRADRPWPWRPEWRGRWRGGLSGRRDGVRVRLAVVGAVAAGWALLGGVTGLVVGVGLGCVVARMGRGSVAEAEFDTAEAARQLPLAADLVAACVAAGAGPVVAAQAVGESLRGPVGERLAWGAAQVRLGGEPADAWRQLGAVPGAGALARLLERAGESGAPAAAPVARLAADCRAERAREATARARRAAVAMTAPVGLCFLPAFIALGVVPVVMGLGGALLGAR
ncbi:type II secretion system F family protein [Streptomyces sp. AN091965]|uniref:type II secretion system F family protein n=1 Tax=Streptomyces sp. AN091965 TaxID=2927803 RepID=UPI001F6152F4|nr:type II secretion system F family protein [Streptomyces sp. AN091965]MCI3932100.1 type II secretion system F family protein [Streptomyces sp. AN091965]